MYRICLERIELIALVAGDFLEVSLGTFESLCTLPRSMRTRSIAPSPCSPGSTTHLHGDKPRWSLAHAHRAIFGGMSPAITCAAGYHSQVPCRIYAARATSHGCAKPRIYGRIFFVLCPGLRKFRLATTLSTGRFKTSEPPRATPSRSSSSCSFSMPIGE